MKCHYVALYDFGQICQFKWASYGWAKVGKGGQSSQFNLEDFLLNNLAVIVKIEN